VTDRDALTGRAAALRAELDASFSKPRLVARPALTQLLAIRIGESPYAMRLADSRALVADRPITRLPTPLPELIGLCAVRGAIAPVYDLAAVLGRAITRHRPPRWLLLVQHHELIALAFDGLDGQLAVPTADIAAPQPESEHDGSVQAHGALRPLIRIASVMEAIERRVRPLQEP
jgi:chemotaxis signal transduction protein